MHELPEDPADWLATHQREIGARIRAERLQQNLTQEALHLAAGVDRVTLQRAEAGRDVRISTLLRLARVLGVPLRDLV
ncbi:helix-turn-helix domain-containing protein [Streptomyces uncialis]|uniref:helix-turn-helix domain-containing protein n=1 Tax=Streptomyces uncialis TaxID=1048205 RepID=UPI00378D5F4C